MKKNIFKLKKKQLKDIALELQYKIERGLQEDDTEIRCLPTYINPQTTIKEGKVLVLDLGGTNFRAAVIEFKNGFPVIHPKNNGLKKDLTEFMKDDANPLKEFALEPLFDAMADLIGGLDLSEVTEIGYCFSYPAASTLKKQSPENTSSSYDAGDAVLLKWTKGVNIPEMIGKPVGKLLLDYLNNHEVVKTKTRFTKIRVINDTVASLFAGLTKPGYDAYIGLIVGTGTNMAAFFPSEKIDKLDADYTEEGAIAINLESGNFNPPYLTVVDKIVDEQSETKEEQLFEKAVSGFYLGKVLKYAFPCDEFEDDFDARKLTRMINYPDIHKKQYVKMAHWIYVRSAKLVAASLAGLILELIAKQHSGRHIKRVCLTAEGSLFWSKINKGENYNTLVLENLHLLLGKLGHKDIIIDINQMEDANLIGSAIAALS